MRMIGGSPPPPPSCALQVPPLMSDALQPFSDELFSVIPQLKDRWRNLVKTIEEERAPRGWTLTDTLTLRVTAILERN